MSAKKYLERIENKKISSGDNYTRKELIAFAEKYAKQLTIPVVSDTLILTPKDAEVFFNEILNPKEANDALKKAMLKFITR